MRGGEDPGYVSSFSRNTGLETFLKVKIAIKIGFTFLMTLGLLIKLCYAKLRNRGGLTIFNNRKAALLTNLCATQSSKLHHAA